MKSCRLLPALFVLYACVEEPIPPVTSAAAPFAPIDFFAGHTDGLGTLKVTLSPTRSVHVAGVGRLAQNGSLMLVQRIDEEGKSSRTRRWSIRRTGAATYAGELSDATGPVEAVVSGNVLHLRFRAKGGLHIQQWLSLQPDGRTVRNHLVVRKLGVRVARLDETIRKVD